MPKFQPVSINSPARVRLAEIIDAGATIAATMEGANGALSRFRPRSHQIAPITGAESIEMTDSPPLIRMVGTGTCTEINDTRFGLLVPDADNAIYVTARMRRRLREKRFPYPRAYAF